jgi:RNA polymerase sigma factor (sigma-70 family)
LWLRNARRREVLSRPEHVGGAEADSSWSAAREQALATRAERGDARALEELLEHFAGPLHDAVILPRVGSRAEADEVLRDTLCRAVERLADFRWTDAGLWPWLRRIAIHRIVDGARRRAAARRFEERYEAEVAVLPPRIEAGAEEDMIEAEERAHREKRLGVALEALNERYRRVIQLRVIEERPREECAAALGVTVATFDVLMHRALASLKKTFGEER